MKKILSLVLALSLFCSPVFGADQFQAGTATEYPRGTINPGTVDTEVQENIVSPLGRVLANYREGCAVQYLSASTITVASGEVVCSNASGSIKLMQQNTSSTTVTWSDLDTGSEAVSTTYYVYAVVATATDSTFTVKISTSASSPSGITYYKKLGSFSNNASGDIEQIRSYDSDYPDYDSGWFLASSSTNYTKAHSLSLTPAQSLVIVKGESSGTALGGEPTSTISSGVDTNGNGLWWNADGTNYYVRWLSWATIAYDSSGTSLSINTNVYIRILGWGY